MPISQINTNSIANGAVVAADLATGSVTNEKIDTVAASKLTGAVPLANGGTGSATQNFVDLTTNQTAAGNKTFSGNTSITGSFSGDIFTDNTSTGANAELANPSNVIVEVTNGSLSAIRSIVAPTTVKKFTLTNRTGGPVLIENEGSGATAANRILTGTGADIEIADNSSVEMYYSDTETRWYVVGGAGGASLGVDTISGASLTCDTKSFQKVRYTGGSAQTLTTLNFDDLPDGGRLVITGSSDTNTLTIPTTIANVRMNGERVLYQYSAIEFIKDNTDLVEVSRNGI
jgi:hypothetical protein